MGISQSIIKINFEDVQFAINTKQYILIKYHLRNTLNLVIYI